MHFIKRQRTKERDNKYNNYESEAGGSDKDDIKVKINSNKSFFKSKNHDAYVDLDKSRARIIKFHGHFDYPRPCLIC